jgi:hypothetical protein
MPRRNYNANTERRKRAKKKRKPATPGEYNRRIHQYPRVTGQRSA